MKLLRFKLDSPFRSLSKGFEVDFFRDSDRTNIWDFAPYCLVGRNGSGKSNILEALAAIFFHIESMYLITVPEHFEAKSDGKKGFKREFCYPDAFELEYIYYIPGSFTREFSADFDIGHEAHIIITKIENEAPQIKWVNREELEPGASPELSSITIKSILPDYIIGYSSGENEILSLPFFKMRFVQYDEYVERLVKDFDYVKPETRLIYLDESFNQAILLALYLTEEKDSIDGESRSGSLGPFEKEVGIEDILSFRIIIRKHHYEDIHNDKLSTLSTEEKQDENNLKVELTTKITNVINDLKRCSTTHFFNGETDELYLDYSVDLQLKKAFRLTFGSALELFQSFRILINLNLYQVKSKFKKKVYHSSNIYLGNDVVPVPYDEERIFRFKDVELKKNQAGSTIYTKSLSDGEYQLLHSIGLCLIFKDTNSLFLLDEPETHFNPDWRAKFISTLRDCLEENKGTEHLRDLLITSHSPFIVSDSHKENVLVFEKGALSPRRPDFNTFGASVNLITMALFDRVDTIGDLANEKILEFEKKIQKGDNLDILKDEIFETLGDSVERTMLINLLIQKRDKR